MHTDQVVKWLRDKNVRPEFIFRLAALISTFVNTDKMTPEAALAHWKSRRPEWWEA
jgi:hypothetical protein